MDITLMASLLRDDPVIFGVVIGAVVLVAVAVILYIFVFHKMLKRRLANRSANKADKVAKHEKSTSMASDIFKEKQADEQRAQEVKKASAIDVDELEARIKANKNEQIHGSSKPAPKKPAKPKKEEPKAFDVNSQFKGEK